MYVGDYTPWRRDAMFDTRSIDDVKNTLSSWDNCMAKQYCKWPVIAAIIVGALLVLSILWCIFSCICCASRVCCCCTDCFRSCCSCCFCCDSKGRQKKADRERNRSSYIKYDDSDGVIGTQPSPMPAPVYYPPPNAPSPHLPTVAQFDTPRKPPPVPAEAGGGKYNPDALPPMPAWSEAKTKHVELDDLEMNTLPPANPPHMGGGSTPLLPPQHDPMGRTMSPGFPDQAGPAPWMSQSSYYPEPDYAQPVPPAPSRNFTSSPAQQPYTSPNTAPYPHSMADRNSRIDMPEIVTTSTAPEDDYTYPHPQQYPQQDYGYSLDAWRRSPVQRAPSPGFSYVASEAVFAPDRAATASPSAANRAPVPSMLTPGPRQPSPRLQQQGQRQSAELGF